MTRLPANVVPYFRTAEFTERSLPEALLREHVIRKPDVWVRVFVSEGSIEYRTLGERAEGMTAAPGREAIIAPGEVHRLHITGPVRLKVEFLREQPQLHISVCAHLAQQQPRPQYQGL